MKNYAGIQKCISVTLVIDVCMYTENDTLNPFSTVIVPYYIRMYVLSLDRDFFVCEFIEAISAFYSFILSKSAPPPHTLQLPNKTTSATSSIKARNVIKYHLDYVEEIGKTHLQNRYVKNSHKNHKPRILFVFDGTVWFSPNPQLPVQVVNYSFVKANMKIGLTLENCVQYHG